MSHVSAGLIWVGWGILRSVPCYLLLYAIVDPRELTWGQSLAALAFYLYAAGGERVEMWRREGYRKAG